MALTQRYIVNEHPWVSTALLALGSFSVARVVYQTLSVLLQTFVLPGKSVRLESTTKPYSQLIHNFS